MLHFFLGKSIYKSNRKLFSCISIACYKHQRDWGRENSRKSCKPETMQTVENSPNPSRAYIRPCKHGKHFLLLKNLVYQLTCFKWSLCSRCNESWPHYLRYNCGVGKLISLHLRHYLHLVTMSFLPKPPYGNEICQSLFFLLPSPWDPARASP